MKLARPRTDLRLDVSAFCLEFQILKDIACHVIEAGQICVVQVDVFKCVLLQRILNR